MTIVLTVTVDVTPGKLVDPPQIGTAIRDAIMSGINASTASYGPAPYTVNNIDFGEGDKWK